MNTERLDRISKLAIDLEHPLLVTKKEHIFYLTGHFFIDGYLLVFPKVSRKQTVFLGFGLEHPRGLKYTPVKDLPKIIRGSKQLNVEDSVTASELSRLKKMLKGTAVKSMPSPVVNLRELKSAQEIAALTDAYTITASVFGIIQKKLKSQQWTEIGLARYIRVWGLELGADDVSFEPIVAAGNNSAVPHHHPTERVIKPGDPVVLDFGFKVNGYCSDFTRTVFLKRASKEMKAIYSQVEATYLQCLQAARSGISGGEIDSVAREYLKAVNLDQYFIHSLGHGTGLEVHELPYLGPNAKNILEDGMVFSIEPGVYLPDKGGVRIEDLVYLENGQAHRFARVPTALIDNII